MGDSILRPLLPGVSMNTDAVVNKFTGHGVLAGILFFVFSFSILFCTLEDPGMTIDEPYVNRGAAISFVTWLSGAGSDLIHGDWDHLISRPVIDEYFKDEYIYHPPFARMLVGVTWKLFHNSIGEIKALRLAPALLFSIAVSLLFLLMSEHYGFLPGLISGAGLLLLPPVFGHAHLIALDSPIASMWLITTICFVKGLESNRWALAFGVVLGLTLNTKIHGFAVPFPLFFWGMIYNRERMAANIWSCVILTPLVLWLSNPLYWHAPLHAIVDFLEDMMVKQSYEKIPSSFLGEKYDFSPPKYYAPFMMLITTPPLLLLVSFAGMIWAAVHGFKGKSESLPTKKLDVLFLLNLLAAAVLTMFKNIPLYDGVRLFLPAYCFIAGLAGTGLFYISQRIKKEAARFFVIAGVTGMTLLFSAISLVRIHPFELSYFNMLIGGLPGAMKKGLEPTYWNDAFTLETAKFMRENYSDKIFSWKDGVRITFDYYKEIGALGETITQEKSGYDYYIVQYRTGWFTPQSWFYFLYLAPEYSVQREGVPLFEIYKSFSTLESERPDLIAEENVFPLKSTGLSWNKYLLVKDSGKYQFGLWTQNDARLWVDFRSVKPLAIRHNNIWEYEVFLDKGVHVLRLDFPLSSKAPKFIPAWITPGGRKELIPAERLVAMDEPEFSVNQAKSRQ